MKHATHLTTRLLVTGALLGASSAALAEISANIGVTSNYVWRGVTQTDNQAAIQGGVDYAHDNGLYVGAWASNVDFSADGASGGTGYELDIYGGYGGSVNDFGYDIGLIYYTYTDSDDANFLELGLSGSYKMFTLGVNYTLDGEADDDSTFAEGDLYYYASLAFDLPQDFGLGLTVGKYDFDDTADTEYTHWQIDLSKSAGDFGDFTFSVSGAEDEAGNPNGDDTMFFVSWAKSF